MLTYWGHNFIFTRNPIEIARYHIMFFLIQLNFGGLLHWERVICIIQIKELLMFLTQWVINIWFWNALRM